jgi:hypothetical protein
MSKPWTEKSKVNFRIEVDARGYSHLSRSRLTEEQKKHQICSDLNDFFNQHKDCPFEAFVECDEIDICHFCKEPYEDDDGNCASCGKGAKEMMLENLADKEDKK